MYAYRILWQASLCDSLNSSQFYKGKDRTLNGKDSFCNGKDVIVTVNKWMFEALYSGPNF